MKKEEGKQTILQRCGVRGIAAGKDFFQFVCAQGGGFIVAFQAGAGKVAEDGKGAGAGGGGGLGDTCQYLDGEDLGIAAEGAGVRGAAMVHGFQKRGIVLVKGGGRGLLASIKNEIAGGRVGQEGFLVGGDKWNLNNVSIQQGGVKDLTVKTVVGTVQAPGGFCGLAGLKGGGGVLVAVNSKVGGKQAI